MIPLLSGVLTFGPDIKYKKPLRKPARQTYVSDFSRKGCQVSSKSHPFILRESLKPRETNFNIHFPQAVSSNPGSTTTSVIEINQMTGSLQPVSFSAVLKLVQVTRVFSLGWEDPLEEGMKTHSSILAWRIPWTEEPGGLQSIGLQRVRHD